MSLRVASVIYGGVPSKIHPGTPSGIDVRSGVCSGFSPVGVLQKLLSGFLQEILPGFFQELFLGFLQEFHLQFQLILLKLLWKFILGFSHMFFYGITPGVMYRIIL